MFVNRLFNKYKFVQKRQYYMYVPPSPNSNDIKTIVATLGVSIILTNIYVHNR